MKIRLEVELTNLEDLRYASRKRFEILRDRLLNSIFEGANALQVRRDKKELAKREKDMKELEEEIERVLSQAQGSSF